MLSIEDIKQICRQFNVGELKCIHKHFEGSININLLIEAEMGKYILKLIHSDKDRIRYIINVQKKLQANGVPVLLPLKDRNNEHFISFDCDRKVQLTPYMYAEHFNKLNIKQILSSGRVLRQMHNILADFNDESEPNASIYPSQSVLYEGLRRLDILQSSIVNNQVYRVFELCREILAIWENKSQGLPKTIIHGDWNERNQLFTAEGEVCCVFDFDYVQRKERLFDVAFALWNFLTHKDLNSLTVPFMQSYGPLTEPEVSILPLAIARVSLFFMCTASLSQNPVNEVNNQLNEQLPFIQYILSKDGTSLIAE